MTTLERKAEWVLGLYRMGYFPMADERGKIHVHNADPRAVLPLDEFHVPKRLARVLRQGRFQVRFNTRFEEVMRGCSQRSTTWISPEIIDIYTQLHRQGWAHSVEAWHEDKLAGGLYGISLGGAF